MPAAQRRRQAGRMDAFDAMSKNTSAFFLQAAIAFGVSFLGVLGGIFFLPLDIWPRLFLAMSAVFLVTSSFTLAKVIREVFDLRPYAIQNQLELLNPMYQATAAYGHFGREPFEMTYEYKDNGEAKSKTFTAFTWERTDKVDALKAAAGV